MAPATQFHDGVESALLVKDQTSFQKELIAAQSRVCPESTLPAYKDQNSLQTHVIKAQFHIRIKPVLLAKKNQDAFPTEFIVTQPVHDEITISSPPAVPLLTPDDIHETPLEKRLEWVTAISHYFLGSSKQDCAGGVRDTDLFLNGDGSIENLSEDPLKFSAEEDGLKGYPA